MKKNSICPLKNRVPNILTFAESPRCQIGWPTYVNDKGIISTDPIINLPYLGITSLSRVPITSVLNVTTLYLDNNNLQNVESLDCYPNLKTLSLVNNNIETLSWCALAKNVETLNLSRNKIESLLGITHLRRIKRLILSQNQIYAVPAFPQTFPVHFKLEHLDLSGNKLTDLMNLSRFFKLKELLLHNNGISWSSSWNGVLPSSLEVLTLSYNSFGNILDFKGLQFYDHLSSLTVEGNPCFGPLVLLDKNGKQIGNNRGFDYRPYMLICSPKLQLLDGKEIKDEERKKSLWLLNHPKKIPPKHVYIIMFLAKTCPCIPDGTLSDDCIFDNRAPRRKSGSRNLSDTQTDPLSGDFISTEHDGSSESEEKTMKSLMNICEDSFIKECHFPYVRKRKKKMQKSESFVICSNNDKKPCSHYIEVIEEKARHHKLERELEKLTEQQTTLIKRIQFLMSVLAHDEEVIKHEPDIKMEEDII